MLPLMVRSRDQGGFSWHLLVLVDGEVSWGLFLSIWSLRIRHNKNGSREYQGREEPPPLTLLHLEKWKWSFTLRLEQHQTSRPLASLCDDTWLSADLSGRLWWHCENWHLDLGAVCVYLSQDQRPMFLMHVFLSDLGGVGWAAAS